MKGILKDNNGGKYESFVFAGCDTSILMDNLNYYEMSEGKHKTLKDSVSCFLFFTCPHFCVNSLW